LEGDEDLRTSPSTTPITRCEGDIELGGLLTDALAKSLDLEEGLYQVRWEKSEDGGLT